MTDLFNMYLGKINLLKLTYFALKRAHIITQLYEFQIDIETQLMKPYIIISCA